MSDTVINKYHLYLESTQRTSGTNEDANYILSRPLFKSNPFNHFEVSVVQANIPYSFFNITNQNGTYSSFQWYVARGLTYPSTNYVVGSPSNPRTATIPNGNYTILTLITALQTAIIGDLQTNYPTFPIPNWTWTYNRDTLTVNFLLTGTDNTTTTYYFMPSSVAHGGLAYNMGITSLLTFGYDSTNVSQPINIINNVKTSGSYGQSAINVAPITSIMIRSGTLKQNRSYEFIAITDDISDILVRVPIMTVGTTFIQYVNEGRIANRVKNEFIDSINLYLTDNRSYVPISLAGLSWMCVLEITEIEGHENRENMAYQMLKQVDFATGQVPVEQEP
jgi:hypothetical protein